MEKKTRVELQEVSEEELAELGGLMDVQTPGGTEEEEAGEPAVAQAADVGDVPAVIDDLPESLEGPVLDIPDELADDAAALEAELQEEAQAPPPEPQPTGPIREWDLGMLYDDLLVEQTAAPESASKEVDIALPDAYRDAHKPLEGIVHMVGSGYAVGMDAAGEPVFRRMLIQVGDRIHFGSHAAQPVEIDGRQFQVIKEAAVLAFWRVRPLPEEETQPYQPTEEEAAVSGCLEPTKPPEEPNLLEQ